MNWREHAERVAARKAALLLPEHQRERREVIAVAAGDTYRAVEALLRIEVRVVNDGFSAAQTDADLFILVLAELLRSARALGELGLDVEDAMDAFDASVPDARRARNILSHLDEYRLGCGQLQDGSGRPLQICYSRGGESMQVLFSNPEIAMDLRPALASAVRLAEAVLDAVHEAQIPASKPECP